MAAGLQFIPECGLVQHHPQDDCNDHGEEDRDGGGLDKVPGAKPAQVGNLRLRGDHIQTECLAVVRGEHDAVSAAVHDCIHAVQADPVEHDRGDHLIDVEVCLEEARDRTPQCTEEDRGQHADIPRELQHEGEHQRAEYAQGELAGGTDVEQAGCERKRDGKAGHDQRSRIGDFIPRAERFIAHAVPAALQNGFEAFVIGVGQDITQRKLVALEHDAPDRVGKQRGALFTAVFIHSGNGCRDLFIRVELDAAGIVVQDMQHHVGQFTGAVLSFQVGQDIVPDFPTLQVFFGAQHIRPRILA